MSAALSVATTALLDVIFPPKCSICNDLGSDPACNRCLEGFHEISPPICIRCGNPREEGGCRQCRLTPAEFLTSARSAGVYEGALRKAIHRLKYDGRRALALPLGEFLANSMMQKPFGRVQFDFLIPIPLHPKRELERGFNQAAIIASEVGRILPLRIEERCVQRIKATPHQVGLTASARASNLKGAFKVSDPAVVFRRTILLIDDVATTLSTGNSCAESLLEAGAKEVYLATVARDL